MVKIAIAGGSGQVAREVIDVLSAPGKHEIMILSRSKPFDVGKIDTSSNIAWRAVDYSNKDELVATLRGFHTVLSFIQLLSDQGNQSQKNLIDACVIAGVKRFAPSEWGRCTALTHGLISAGLDDMPWWAGKKEIRQYCEQVNAKEKILEYTLFQPGLFLEYLASPYQTAKHLSPLDTMFDFQNRRAIVVDGHEDAILTLTSVQDLARIVAEAVEYEGVWPVHGGIRGNKLTASEILTIAQKVRGQPIAVERVRLEDLQQGKLDTSWVIGKRHSAVKEEEADALARTVLAGMLLTCANGAWEVSDGFNRLLPQYAFIKAEGYLARVWLDKA